MRQEEVAFSCVTLSAGSREEALPALRNAKHVTPAVLGQLVNSHNAFHLMQPTSTKKEKSDDALVGPAHAHDKPISAAELSSRTYNALLRGRVTTIGQFCAMELADLMLLRNFGKKAAEEALAYRVRLGIGMV